jgi:hypothetical protein
MKQPTTPANELKPPTTVGSGDLLGCTVIIQTNTASRKVDMMAVLNASKAISQAYGCSTVCESQAPPFSKTHQILLRLVCGALYRLGDFFNQHRLPSFEKYALYLAYRFRFFIHNLHERKNAVQPNRKS